MKHEVQSSPGFWAYYLGTTRRPGRTLQRLLGEQRQLRFGTAALLLTGVLYTVAVLLLALAGAGPTVPPWLAIPPERYLYWEVLFILPVYVGTWILAAGVIQLTSKAWGGVGTFEGTLSLLGFAIALPTYATLVPDTVIAVLALAGVIDWHAWEEASTRFGPWLLLVWSYLAVYITGFLFLFTKAVAASQQLSGARAVAVGLVGFIVFQGVFFVFIR